jgi:octaprenyl-diphosphate synthase
LVLLNNPFYKLQSFLKDDLEKVDEILVHQFFDRSPLLVSITKHLINAGGKRVRPILTLASFRSIAGQDYFNKKIYSLCASVELIHTATLLHDDVVDSSGMRRHKKTANAVWGNQPCILVGDFLFARSFNLMVETENLKILDILANASAQIAEGEVMQLCAKHDLNQTIDQSLKVMQAKTAVLFAAACQTGSLIGGADMNTSQGFYQFGFNFGTAYQILDDVLDYKSKCESDFGKTPGQDFIEGKITLPVLLSIKKFPDLQLWQRCFVDLKPKKHDFKKLHTLMEENHIFSKCLDIAKNFTQSAINDLEKIGIKNENTNLLKQLVDDSLLRNF